MFVTLALLLGVQEQDRPPQASAPLTSDRDLFMSWSWLVRASFFRFENRQVGDASGLGVTGDMELKEPGMPRWFAASYGASYDVGLGVRLGGASETRTGEIHFLRAHLGQYFIPTDGVFLWLRGGIGGVLGPHVYGDHLGYEIEFGIGGDIGSNVSLRAQASYIFSQSELAIRNIAQERSDLGRLWMIGVGISIGVPIGRRWHAVQL